MTQNNEGNSPDENNPQGTSYGPYGSSAPSYGSPSPYGSSEPSGSSAPSQEPPYPGAPSFPAGPSASSQEPPYPGAPGYPSASSAPETPAYPSAQSTGGAQPYQAGYPAAAYPGYGAPVPSGPPPKRTGPVLMIVLGFLAMIIAPIVGIGITAASVAGTALDALGGMTDVSSDGGSTSLEAYTSYQLMDMSPGDTIGNADSCQVVDPAGVTLFVSPETDTTFGSTFTSTESGMYTFTCPDISGPVSVISGMGESELMEMGGTMVGSLGPTVAGFIIGFVGLVVGIVGIVLLVRVNKKRRMMGL